MARGSLELGYPQSQGFVDAEQGGRLLNAKRPFRRVHRDHADAPLPPLAICTSLTNANTRPASSWHGPVDQLLILAIGSCSSSEVKEGEPATSRRQRAA